LLQKLRQLGDVRCNPSRLVAREQLGRRSPPHSMLASSMLPPARLPENLPTPTNSIVLFVVLCLLIFGLMAFAKFMQQRERKRRD
jgi:hypothetical protein